MPVSAAGEPDIGAADPQPAVPLGGGEHPIEQLAVGGLDRGALGEGVARLGDADGEEVADALQLTEVEDARRPGRGDPVRDVDPSQSGGDESGELQLQLPHLTAQLGTGAKLLRPQPLHACPPMGNKHRPLRLPFEQIRHGPILSRLEGRGGNP